MSLREAFASLPCVLGLFLAAPAAHGAEPGDLLWAKRAGGDSYDDPRAVAAFADGSCVVVGSFDRSATFGAGETNETTLVSSYYDAFIARYDPDGSLAWAKGTSTSFGTAAAYGAAAFPDGSCFVTGYFYGSVTFAQGETNETTLVASLIDVFVARYDADGSLIWARHASSSYGYTIPAGMGAFPDGSSVVTGYFTGSITFGPGETNETTLVASSAPFDDPFWGYMEFFDVFVARYDADGSLAWAKRAGGEVEAFTSARALGVGAFPDGSSVVTGQFAFGKTNEYGPSSLTFGEGEANETTLVDPLYGGNFVTRYNADGSLAWAKRVGDTLPGYGYAFPQTTGAFPDASFVVVGTFYGNVTFGVGETNETTLAAPSSNDLFVARYDADGSLAWARHASSSYGYALGSATPVGMGTFPDGSSGVTGYFTGTVTFGQSEPNETTLAASSSNSDPFVARYDTDGSLTWARHASSSYYARGVGMGAFPDGSSVVVGIFSGSATFGQGETSETTLVPANSFPDVFVARYAGERSIRIVAPESIVQECDGEDEHQHGTVNFVFEAEGTLPGTAVLRVTDVTGNRTLLEQAAAEGTFGVGPHAFPIGSSTVLIEIIDGVEVLASATVAVQIEDRVPPTLTGYGPSTIECQAPLTTLFRSLLGIDVADDCDPNPMVTFVPAALGLGTTEVTATARDAAGNGFSCTFDVTVVDTTPAVFTVRPADLERECEAGEALVSFDVLAEDLSGAVVIACEDETGRAVDKSGTLFDVGEHTVTCRATDSTGNVAACSFHVTVIDAHSPVIVVPSDITVGTAPGVGHAFVEFTVTAMDECDPDAGIVCMAPWGPVQSGDAFPVGTTTVACTATDHSGNAATLSFNITVEDREPPVLSGPESVDLTTDCSVCECGEDHEDPTPRCRRKRNRGFGGRRGRDDCRMPCEGGLLPVSAASLGVTATDNCDADVAIVVAPASVGPGTTEVVLTATDDDGNRSQKSVHVTVLKGPFECRLLRPLDAIVDNRIRACRTIPLRLRVLCGNRFVEDATARVESVVRIDGSGTPIANDADEDDSSLIPDDGYMMKRRGNHYAYNLRTQGWPQTSGARFKVVLRVTKTGHVDTVCEVILKNR